VTKIITTVRGAGGERGTLERNGRPGWFIITTSEVQETEKEKQMTAINEIRDAAWRIAREHGFTDNSVEGDIALMHSELSEALEDLRNRAAVGEVWYEEKIPAFHANGEAILVDGKQATVAMKFKEPYRVTEATCTTCKGEKVLHRHMHPTEDGPRGPSAMVDVQSPRCAKCLGTGKEIVLRKPCGIPSELADVIIRALHFSGKHSIDIGGAIGEKMNYNETRPYKHGGKTI